MSGGSAKRQRIIKRLLNRQGGCCYYCNEPITGEKLPPDPEAATIDHRVPRSQGGKNDWINIVAACFPCNNRKGDMPVNTFIQICFEQP